MVVVILIAILAVIAVPTMAVARLDRMAFREADTFARLIHGARLNAMARGSAQFVLITSDGATDRGTLRVFETLDATGHPQSPCKLTGQWGGLPAGSATNPIVAGENLNGAADSTYAVAGIETSLSVGGGSAVKAVGICFTPGGRTYVASGADLATVLAAIPTTLPFNSDLSIGVMRKPGGGTAVGVTRTVIMTATGATRIRSK